MNSKYSCFTASPIFFYSLKSHIEAFRSHINHFNYEKQSCKFCFSRGRYSAIMDWGFHIYKPYLLIRKCAFLALGIDCHGIL